MIGKLKGRVDSCSDDHAIIDVNGVGYLVYCSAKSLHKLTEGDFCQLFIDTHVREDHIHLYGFLSLQEKAFFNILQSVNGIGTRMALSILSQLTPEQIAIAVSQKDKDSFRSVSGVGPKLAERILIELKDKVGNNFPNCNFSNSTILNTGSITSDAISALTNLGINKIEAQNSVVTIFSKNPEILLDELIRLALKERAQQ